MSGDGQSREKRPAVKGVKTIVLHQNLVVCRQQRQNIGELPSIKGSKCRLLTSLIGTRGRFNKKQKGLTSLRIHARTYAYDNESENDGRRSAHFQIYTFASQLNSLEVIPPAPFSASRCHGCLPFSPPGYAFIFIAHRAQFPLTVHRFSSNFHPCRIPTFKNTRFKTFW